MMIDKESMDYHCNLMELDDMEDRIPMTRNERNCIRKWVRNGHSIETNPWNYTDSDNYQLNYLQAFRLKYGYPSGRWDYWKGPDEQLLWDEERNSFFTQDEQN